MSSPFLPSLSAWCLNINFLLFFCLVKQLIENLWFGEQLIKNLLLFVLMVLISMLFWVLI